MLFLLLTGLIGAVVNERMALASPVASAAVLTVLGLAALFCVLRNNRMANNIDAELRFEEIPSDQLVSLNLY